MAENDDIRRQEQEADSTATAISLLETIGSGLPEAKEFMKIAGDLAKNAKPPKVPTNETETQTTEAEVEPEVTQAEEGEEGESPLKGEFFEGEKPKGYKFTTNEDFLKEFEKKFGAKDIKGYAKAMQSIDKWRTESQKAGETEQKLTELTTFLSALPLELSEGLIAYSKGQYDRSMLNKFASQPDFSQPVEKQNPKQLINYYYPSEFESEDLEAYDARSDTFEDKVLQKAYEVAKNKFFTADKQKLEDQRASYDEQAQKTLVALKESATGSVEHLRKSFPSLKENVIRETEQLLLSGDDSKILGLFKDSKGQYKKEAALAIAMAKHGYSQIETLKALIEEQNKSMQVAVDVKKTPEASKGRTGASQEQQEQFVKEARSALGGMNHDPFKSIDKH